MVIRLSPALEERIERAAKEEGIKPDKLVEKALDEYLTAERQRRQPTSEARRQLQELAQDKKKVVDFDAAVEEAKRNAGKLYDDNADWIERAVRTRNSHG